MTDIGQHHDPRYVPGDYDREVLDDPDAGTVIVYKLLSPGTPIVATSAHCVTRSTGYEQWQLWSPERLDSIREHWMAMPLVALAVAQCRRMSAGLDPMPRWEEEAWLAQHAGRAA